MKKFIAFMDAASKTAKLGILAAALTLLFLMWVWLKPTPPAPVVTPTSPNTISVQVPVEKIVYKDVIKYVEDDANVKRLLKENERLKVQVAQLSETIATYKVQGAGTVTTVPTETLPPVMQPNPPDVSPTVTEYKDWRLHFVHDGSDARYTLTQQFEVLSTTGRRNKQGTPVNLVKLFEIGPDGQRLPIPDTKTVTLFADDTRPSWNVGLTLQAGIAYTTDKKLSGVAGVQWLKRGRTEAAEDSSLSLLTPALLVSDSGSELGVLPVSLNLGRIKNQPFKDLWVSPFIGYDSATKGLGKIAITFTASF